MLGSIDQPKLLKMMMSKHKADDSDINAAERENLILSMAKTMKPSLPQPAKEKPKSLIET